MVVKGCMENKELKRLRQSIDKQNKLMDKSLKNARAQKMSSMVKSLFEGLAIHPVSHEQSMQFLLGKHKNPNGYQKQIRRLKRSVRKRSI